MTGASFIDKVRGENNTYSDNENNTYSDKTPLFIDIRGIFIKFLRGQINFELSKVFRMFFLGSNDFQP